jgi:hypothetical protein
MKKPRFSHEDFSPAQAYGLVRLSSRQPSYAVPFRDVCLIVRRKAWRLVLSVELIRHACKFEVGQEDIEWAQ